MHRRPDLHRRLGIAQRRLSEGISPDQIASDFISWGVEEDQAHEVVKAAQNQLRQDQFREAVRPIWVGGSMLLVGLLLTMIGFQRSSMSDGQVHRYLLLGMGILPAAMGYAIFGFAQCLAHFKHARMADEEAPQKTLAPPARDMKDVSITVPQRMAA